MLHADPCPLCGKTGAEECVTRSGRPRRSSHASRETPAPARAKRPGVRYLSDSQVRQIRILRSMRTPEGRRVHKLAELAARFGTTETTISRIGRGKNHVPVPRPARRKIRDQET